MNAHRRWLIVSVLTLSLLAVAGLLLALDHRPVSADSHLIVTPGTTQEVLPGNTVTYTHDITNTDNNDAITVTISVATSNDTDFSAAVSTDTVVLNKNQQQSENYTATISVYVTASLLAEPTASTVTTVTFSVDGFEDVEVENTTTILFTPGVDIEPPGAKTADAGTVVTFTHTITNLGNLPDTFNYWVVSASGYPVTPSLGTPGTVGPLATDASQSVEISVGVPPGADGGTVSTATVYVENESETATDSVVDQITVNTIAGVALSSRPAQTAQIGDAVIFTHVMTNTGNRSDTFDLSTDSPSLAVVSPTSVELDRDESTTVELTVNVPTDECDTSLAVELTATSNNDAEVSETVTDNVNVEPCRIFLPILTKPREWAAVGAGSWPNNVTARSVAVCRSDPNLIFAGTADGRILRYNGNNWQPQTTSIPNQPGVLIYSMVMNNNCTTVYAGTYGSGNDNVWRGQLGAGGWTWSVEPSTPPPGGFLNIRAVVVSDGEPFVGDDKGLYYRAGNAWTLVSGVNQGGIAAVSVADKENNSGPVYAVFWQNRRVYANFDPDNTPGAWTDLGLPNLPFADLRAVTGDQNGVNYVGGFSGERRWTGNEWEYVSGRAARVYFDAGDTVFVGYEDGSGVYKVSKGQSTMLAINDGFPAIPSDVLDLTGNADFLLAATSNGVWRR
ncbi:MAG: hypothetical protein R3300_01550 [Candidatus Promineifilaceae bacterium]|nr:hypothetical protein [Candidatus Promineifilaceae bacterium]